MMGVWTLARITWRRTLRGRALWVAVVVALLPIVFATVQRQTENIAGGRLGRTFTFELLVLAVLPALLVAGSIGEEIEERTITYVWSRPVPRWALVAGKLVAMLPVIYALSIASWCAASYAGVRELPSPESVLALVVCATALALVGSAIALLVPRYSIALVICYLLFFDLPMGAMPAAIEHLSVTRHARVIAGTVVDPDAVSVPAAVIGTLVIALIWTVVGLWRIRRLEA